MSTKTLAKPKSGSDQPSRRTLARPDRRLGAAEQDDRLWQAQFAASADVAQSIDDEVLEEYRNGRTARIGK